MINTAGEYILVLIYTIFSVGGTGGGLAMHEFPNFESCQATITQLDPVSYLTGYCIAKEVKE